MFKPSSTGPNLHFLKIFMLIGGANYDQIWLPRGLKSDFEQCLNRLQLHLISILVNFSCKLGQIMTRYDFQEADFNFGQLVWWIGASIMGRYDFIEATRVSFSNIRSNFNFIFGQFSIARKLILNSRAIRPTDLLLHFTQFFPKNWSVTFSLFCHKPSQGWY